MGVLTALFFIIGFSLSVGFFISFLQKKTTPTMIGPLVTSKLCKLHNWKEAKLITVDDLDTFNKDPENYPEVHFCIECGYVPRYKGMIVQKFLDQLKLQMDEIKRQQDRAALVNSLKKQCLKNYLNANTSLTSGDIVRIKEGFDLYDRFVDNLPTLVQLYYDSEKEKYLTNESK